MLTCILERILIRVKKLETERDLGNGIKIAIAYGPDEKRYKASMTEGEVISIGDTAFLDHGYSRLDRPVKVGDKVIVAKFSPHPVIDPDAPTDSLALINDEDVLAIITSKEKTNE